MDTRLNLFAPYESAPAWHENQLTRALLVVLRYSPMCHQAWMQLVAPEHKLHELPAAEFATQRQRVLTKADIAEGDAIDGVSVWLAPDAAQIDESIQSSDRQQILDGVVTYGSDLVVVIENKIVAGGVTEQPHQINLHGSPVVFDPTPRSVAWRELLGVVSDLIERGLVSGSERMLLSDFLEFVEQHFPDIGPCSTLSRCGGNRFRLERRLDTIQGKALSTDKGKGLGWRDIEENKKIFMAWLGIADDTSAVCLRMYPGDTLGQSRAFYADRQSVADVLALRSNNWVIEPNFHWGFMAAGYAWMKTPLTVEEYCAYWVKEMAKTREIVRSEWEEYWFSLESVRIVEPNEKGKFDAEFTKTQRQRAQPRPGLLCEYRWTLKEAKRLDERDKFVEAVRNRVNEMLSALRTQSITNKSDD